MPTKLDYFLDGNPKAATDREKNGHKVTEKDKPFTHWSFENKEKWFIPEDEMQEFYELYCRDIVNCVPRFLTEKQTQIGMMRLDLDMIYDKPTDEHRHTRDQVISFMKAYMAEAKKYLNVPDCVSIYILEKDCPTETANKEGKKYWKSGFHAQIPELKTRANIEQTIRRNLLKRMPEFFPGLEFAEGKTWEDIYDKQPLTHTNNWPVLGSKKPGGMPYLIRYILDWDAESGDISVDEDVPAITPKLIKWLSVRSSPNEETELTDDGKQIARPIQEDTHVRSTSRGRAAHREPPSSRGSSPGRGIPNPLTEGQLTYVTGHVKNLAAFRYTNYTDWVLVGQTLKNIHPTDLLDVWLDFSHNDPRYNEREATYIWNSFSLRTEGPRMSIASLRYWSRMDNLEGYQAVERSNLDRLIEESADTGTENDVAQVVYAKYGDDFKCARYGTSEWYRYDGHVWRSTDKGISLQIKLSSEVSKLYAEREQQELNLIAMDPCSHKESDPSCATCCAEKRKKAFNAIRLKLKRTGFKKSVMDECRELFLDEKLALKLDESKNLIAFNNGVFDTLNMEFRDGKPEDYISFCTNIDYNPSIQYYQFECWPELEKFLKSILPKQRVREYFLRHLSTCLSGGNEAQKFHILTGSGSNGKSMLMNLMATAMGDYCCKAPISLLTQQRNKSAAAAPELVRMKGRRFVTMQEPDEQVPLNTGLMKELASCEKITARDLYAGSKQMIDFDIQARFHLACNEKPKVNSNDGGTWRRLVVIDFPMKFVHEPKLPNELPIDESIVQKCLSADWATCFMAYLVHLYKEGNGWRKISPPEEVMEYTQEYKEESDVIARFLREHVRISEETDPEQEKEPVTWNFITTKFQEWKRSNELSARASATELKKRMESQFGKYPKNGWMSFQFESA